MSGPWTKRLLLLKKSCGWTLQRLANELGFSDRKPVNRVIHGGRASVRFVLRLQGLENLHAEQIKRWVESGGRARPKKSTAFPPDWVECRERWFPEDESAARPADLEALAILGSDPAGVLTGRYRPDNFPNRILKVIDWTFQGRALYRKNRPSRARRSKTHDLRSPRVAEAGAQ